MAEPVSTATTLKELAKDPLAYIIAVIIGTGAYLMKDTPIGITWSVGVVLVIFGVIIFLIKFISTLYDGSFKRKYTDIIDTQAKTIKNQSKVYSELSKNAIAAHQGIGVPEKLSGGYERNNPQATATGSSEPTYK